MHIIEKENQNSIGIYYTKKMFPIIGRASSFFEILKNPISIQIESKSNPFLFYLLSSSVSRANMSYAVATIFSSLAFHSLSFSKASLNHLVATIFSSLAFLSPSISMAKLRHLVAESFSSLALLSSSISKVNLRCLLVTTFSSLSSLSNSFHHLASIY